MASRWINKDLEATLAINTDPEATHDQINATHGWKKKRFRRLYKYDLSEFLITASSKLWRGKRISFSVASLTAVKVDLWDRRSCFCSGSFSRLSAGLQGGKKTLRPIFTKLSGRLQLKSRKKRLWQTHKLFFFVPMQDLVVCLLPLFRLKKQQEDGERRHNGKQWIKTKLHSFCPVSCSSLPAASIPPYNTIKASVLRQSF